jgi:hypothetical protein
MSRAVVMFSALFPAATDQHWVQGYTFAYEGMYYIYYYDVASANVTEAEAARAAVDNQCFVGAQQRFLNEVFITGAKQ